MCEWMLVFLQMISIDLFLRATGQGTACGGVFDYLSEKCRNVRVDSFFIWCILFIEEIEVSIDLSDE